MTRQFFSILLLMVTLLGLISCVDVVRRGAVIKPYQLEQLESGKSNYNDVLNILGTPTSVSNYDPRLWYYFSEMKSKWGFLDPISDDQEVYQVRLDEKGNYVSYKLFTGANAVKLAVSKNTTPTVARDKSFLQELLTNFGRYSKPKGGTSGPSNPAQNPLSQ